MSETIRLTLFQPEHQAAARALILAGLEERWDVLDPARNPDLDDIAFSYAEGVFVLAWAGETLIGTGALTFDAPDIGRIQRMSVAQARRRSGVGRRILDLLCAQAWERGCRRIVLETTETWEDAIAFYRNYGFRLLGVWDGDARFSLERPAP